MFYNWMNTRATPSNKFVDQGAEYKNDQTQSEILESPAIKSIILPSAPT